MGAAWGFWKWLDTKLGKKADKSSMDIGFNDVKLEQKLHREYFAKAFDKMEEHAQRDADMHNKLLTQMSEHHAELLRELGRKADR